MKIGYIVLCHQQPEIVAAIVDELTNGTNDLAVVHVDKKVNIDPFKKLMVQPNVIFPSNRIDIHWGGYSSVEATLMCLEVAMSEECDRYILLQGLDYPVKDPEQIHKFFHRNKHVEFIRAYDVTTSVRPKTYMKAYGFHMFDSIGKGLVGTAFARFLNLINKTGVKYRRGYFRGNYSSKKLDIYWGWGHFALTKECVGYIVSTELGC